MTGLFTGSMLTDDAITRCRGAVLPPRNVWASDTDEHILKIFSDVM